LKLPTTFRINEPNIIQFPWYCRSGSYRGLAATANHFARETHMDALARAAKIDPLEFRRKNISDARLRSVLDAAAKSFGWPPKEIAGRAGLRSRSWLRKGRLRCHLRRSGRRPHIRRRARRSLGGSIRVWRHRQSDGLRNQVVGAMIQGLGGALFESIEFENGRIKNPHFATIACRRFRDVPEIEAVLLDRKDLPSGGAGETPS